MKTTSSSCKGRGYKQCSTCKYYLAHAYNVYQKLQEVKSKHPGAIVIYNFNPTYEIYGDDARIVSRVLGLHLRLTTRMVNVYYSPVLNVSFYKSHFGWVLSTLMHLKYRVVILDHEILTSNALKCCRYTLAYLHT